MDEPLSYVKKRSGHAVAVMLTWSQRCSEAGSFFVMSFFMVVQDFVCGLNLL